MGELIISGPAGRIEARYNQAPGENPPIALILHPHPKAGGTMQDPVTITLRQHIGLNQPLRTGSYSKTLTFTLSTTTP